MRDKMKRTLTIVALVAVTAFIGCTTTKLVETPPGSGNYKEVAEVDPRLTAGLETATGVNTVTAPFNPWHGLVTIGIGTIAAIGEWNRRRKQAQLDAVVAGVEAKGGEAVKEAIKNIAMTQKIEGELNKTVKRVTGG